MSHVHLSSDIELLADRLIDEIAARRSTVDPFEPVRIVVPNRFMQQWLKFRLARSAGVAINLSFQYLEQALWDWFREIDPREHPRPVELLDDECYHFLVLSILWNDADPALAPLQAYFERDKRSRLTCRRAWQLAGRLSTLIRDYEYHRQDAIIQHWLDPRSRVDVPASWREREAAQRAVFERVIDETAGRRVLLSRALGRVFKTLPQYVMEFVHEVRDYRTPERQVVHLFGLSQISPLHLRALEVLAAFHDWRVYHYNPLASRLTTSPGLGSLRDLAARFRGESEKDAAAGDDLLRGWGRAGVESLHLVADFLADPAIAATTLTRPAASRRPATRPRRADAFPLFDSLEDSPPAAGSVLSRLQDAIRGASPSGDRVPQDGSLQIARCPGIWREAETIHAAIVHMLNRDSSLRQSDVAVLVSDMDLYRPVLTAVFERPPRRLSFALADYTAARVSTYGQAIVGMLDLALENLSRTRVLEVLLNPCVLSRLGVDRETALTWLTWAENLGIYHGWDAADKHEQGYSASPLFSWKLGLRRLRLGRYMSLAGDDSRPSPEWDGAIPFADVASADPDRLDPFCRVVEGLLPTLVGLRRRRATARDWSEAIIRLMGRYLDVPDDRPEEAPVRDSLLESLARFSEWDLLHPAGTEALLPLPLVREVIVGRLRDIPGRRNEVLSSGVTIASLQPQRPIPFTVIVLAGMGERNFPGGGGAGPLDLRQIERRDGDILPVEQRRQGFLEAILAARKKLVITYDGRDLQKDEELQPAVPVVQLQRFLDRHIVAPAFRPTAIPLHAHDPDYVRPATAGDAPAGDLLVQNHAADRILAIDAAVRHGEVALTPEQAATLDRARDELSATFARGIATTPPDARPTPTVPARRLRKFLENPAVAALRYHLNAAEEWDDDPDDCEPLVSSRWPAWNLTNDTLIRVVHRSESEPIADIVGDWTGDFDRRYREATLRGQAPEGAFAEVDAGVLRSSIASLLTDGGLLDFLEVQSRKTRLGPYLVGESDVPLGARRRVPAVVVPLARPLPSYPSGEARLIGAWPHAWRDADSLDLLMIPSGKADTTFGRSMFEPLLFLALLAAAGEIEDRRVALHVATPKKIKTLPLAGDLLRRADAIEYFGHLVADALDPACADLLPFDCLKKKSNVYASADDPDADAGLLAEWRGNDDERDWGYNQDRLNELSTAGFRVPDDAPAKLRRRFRPLFLLLGGDDE